jgi:hypothetical protein
MHIYAYIHIYAYVYIYIHIIYYIFVYIYTIFVMYSFVLGAPRLTPQLGYCEQYCYKHGCVYGFLSSMFIYSLLDICSGVIWQVHKASQFLIFLRNLYAELHNECTSFHFHQQCIRVPFPQHS